MLKKSEFIGIIIVGILFLVSAYFAQKYDTVILANIDSDSLVGPLVYVLMAIFATVIAPVSATPLIPIAAAIWGPMVTAVLSIVAWTIGTIIAFLLARKYGRKYVEKNERMRGIQKYIDSIPEKKFFWTIVLLRTALPVDLLSYALGLFSNIKFKTYLTTTLIGITPFAFIFSYASTIPLAYQIVVLVLVGLFLYYEYRQFEKKANANKGAS